MKLNGVSYTTNQYKTTNPPISESSELSIFAMGGMGLKLIEKSSYNSKQKTAEYAITQQQFDSLCALFDELHIVDSVFYTLKSEQPKPPIPQMTGGSFNASFTFSANGVSVSTNKITDNINAFISRMAEIKAECGEPTMQY